MSNENDNWHGWGGAGDRGVPWSQTLKKKTLRRPTVRRSRGTRDQGAARGKVMGIGHRHPYPQKGQGSC